MTQKVTAIDRRDRRGEVVLQGTSICPGVGIGRVHIVDPALSVTPTELAPQQVRAEKERYTTAVNATKHRLREHVATVHGILGEVDFISVGTNDLLQYFMAADRDNERVIQYNDAASPAFLWLMEHVIRQAQNTGREADVTVCGEVASDRRVLPHLLRMGYQSFSISPVSTTLFRSVCAEFTMNTEPRERPS